MAAADFKTCPNCQSRNKTGWEFCARCGESLVDVVAGAGSSQAVPTRPAATQRPGISWGGPILVALVIVGLGWLVSSWRPRPPEVTPQTFTIGTSPSPRPPSPVPPHRPGQAAYDEARRLAAMNDPTAFDLFAQAVSEDPRRADFHDAFGRALWKARRMDDAIRELRAAASLEPEQYRLGVAKVLAQAKRFEDALVEYEQVTQVQPDNPQLLFEMGGVLLELKQTERALQVMRRVAELSPGNPTALKAFGAALDHAEQWGAAEPVYRKALEIEPDNVAVRGRLADVLVKQDKRAEAIEVYQEGIKLTPDAADLYRYLGGLYERSKRWADAASAYREYVRLAPEGEHRAEMARRAEWAQGRAGSDGKGGA